MLAVGVVWVAYLLPWALFLSGLWVHSFESFFGRVWVCLYLYLCSIDCSRCLCELANCHRGLRRELRRFKNLVELSCCKLHWTGMCPRGLRGLGLAGLGACGAWGLRGLGLAGLMGCQLGGLVSHWVHQIPPGSASVPLMECGSCWVGMGSGESALSGLSELSFMTLLQTERNYLPVDFKMNSK